MPDNSPIAFDPVADADLSSGEVMFIGTATVLLRYAGFTILRPQLLASRRTRQALATVRGPGGSPTRRSTSSSFRRSTSSSCRTTTATTSTTSRPQS
jgi:hypothetical protein